MPTVIGSVRFFGPQTGLANAPEGVYHTTDGADNWTFIEGHGATHWLTSQVGWLVSGERVERTTDGGRTWQVGSLPPGAYIHDASFIDATTGWAVGDSNRIYRTGDGGMTWSLQFGRDPYPYMLPFSAVDFADSVHGVAVGGQPAYNDGLLFYTSDGGLTWHDAQNGTGEYTEHIMALDANHAWAATNNNIVLYTTDGGTRWNRSKVVGLRMGTILNKVDFATLTTGWVTGADGQVARSTDGGRTWDLQFVGISQYIYGLDAISEQNVIVVGGGPAYRLARHSTDGGATWAEFEPNLPDDALYDVFFINATTGWVVGSQGGIAKSTDGGATWTAQPEVAQYPLAAVHFSDPQNGWTGGTLGELFHTNDGGTTWTRQNAGLAEYGHILGISAVSPTEAWISGSESADTGGRPYIKHTTDGGLTWVDETPPSPQFADFTTVFFLNAGTGWAGGYGGIYHINTGLQPTATPAVTHTAAVPTSTSTSVVGATATRTSLPATATSTIPPQATATATACAVNFTDVLPDSTFYSYVKCLACAGILGGYADGTFRPNNQVTRGQLAKIVANAAGYNEPVSGQTFTDVPTTHTFYTFIERMAASGVLGGYSDGTFRPDNNASRGQIAKIVSNAAGFNEPMSGQTFTDVAPGSTFYEFVERLSVRGIIGGYSDGTFRPGNNATRGQISKMVSVAYFPSCNQ